jgi:Uncharacterized protein conserved in bacteria
MSLMIGIYRFMAARILTIIGLIALCLVIWLLGPKISVGDQAPLAPGEVRMLVIAGIITLWLLSEFIRYLLRRRYTARLLPNLPRAMPW